MKTAHELQLMKGREKIAVLTAYTYPMARCMDGIVDVILVGDSLGMVILGQESTREVTMHDMLRHTAAVARGAQSTFIIGDMPYASYATPQEAVTNATAFLAAGAQGIKIEGSHPEVVSALIAAGIPVMGHVGLTPQTVSEFKVQGRDRESAERILNEAIASEQAGCFSIVLECIPQELAKKITQRLRIPTIGIGAGPSCDGQVLVSHDLLGLYDRLKPKFVKQYVNLCGIMKDTFMKYRDDVKKQQFPTHEHSYS